MKTRGSTTKTLGLTELEAPLEGRNQLVAAGVRGTWFPNDKSRLVSQELLRAEMHGSVPMSTTFLLEGLRWPTARPLLTIALINPSANFSPRQNQKLLSSWLGEMTGSLSSPYTRVVTGCNNLKSPQHSGDIVTSH